MLPISTKCDFDLPCNTNIGILVRGMPATEVLFFKETNGNTPVLEFLQTLLPARTKAYANCLAKIRLLKMFGSELRRPHVDYLRDGIYELRAKDNTVQYPRVKQFAENLNTHHVKATLRTIEGGAHTWPVWRVCLSEFAPMLFR